MKLIGVKKIWDEAPHNALCDLICYNGRLLCVFRESDTHVAGKDGIIRILQSFDGEMWEPIARIEETGIDLRDPKLSITPQGALMLLVCGAKYRKKRYLTRQPLAAFSEDGKKWTPFSPILQERDWLWRVTWHNGIAYGASYCAVDEANPKGEWALRLYSSSTGLDYALVTQWAIPGKPNESTVRFDSKGRMIALVRREQPFQNKAWIGSSQPPYNEWNWKETSHHLGGPNFLILPDDTMWASGRFVEVNPYGRFGRTVLAMMTFDDLYLDLLLPSGGIDTSYPGMLYENEILWLNYYSSHESKTAIYVAKIAPVRGRT